MKDIIISCNVTNIFSKFTFNKKISTEFEGFIGQNKINWDPS